MAAIPAFSLLRVFDNLPFFPPKKTAAHLAEVAPFSPLLSLP